MIKSATFCFSVLACLALQGCYTQLAMFYPDPEIESEDEEQFYDTYSRAIPSLKAEAYAQDGRAATPLSYSSMQRRFHSPYSGYYGNNFYGYNQYYDPYYTGMYGYGLGYNGYNSYGYSPYLYTADPVGYGSIIPMGEREKRRFRRDRSQESTTILTTTRSSSSNNDSGSSSSSYTNISVSTSRSSGSYSASSSSSSSGTRSSSSKSTGGRRATRRR